MRKPRQLQIDARYHVSARAQRQEMIMGKDEMKTLFLQVVSSAKKKYSFRLENFCVLGNHFHFIIQPTNGASLSRIMQWIMSVFAMRWNRLHGISGHVWGQRFFSRIIESFQDLLNTFAYIDENAVKACLVPCAEEWEFGGAWARSRKDWSILDPFPAL